MAHDIWRDNAIKLDDFYGDRGSADSPAIWVLGIEPGWSAADQRSGRLDDNNRSIDIQLRWPFHRKIFKLIAVIEGRPLEHSEQFARERKLFVPGDRSGYMRGNLFPVCCNNVGVWSKDQIDETSFQTKDEYRKWCRENRWPAIAQQVRSLAPGLVIGLGITCRKDFAAAVLGEGTPLKETTFTVGGHTKRMFFASNEGRRLAVIPHTSGRYGLNSNEAIKTAGCLIKEFMKS